MNTVQMIGMLAAAAAPTNAPSTSAPVWFEFLHKNGPLLPLLVLGAVWMFFLRGKKPADKQRELQLKDMKRGDRVQTIGGILGTVVDARETEVVLKVDESSNTKIKFSRSAIHRIVEDEKAAGAVATVK